MNDERQRWLARPPQEALSKKLGIAAWILSSVVLLLVMAMQKIKIPLPEGWSTAFLPPVHALLNSLVAVCLVAALAAVKQGKIALHRRLIFAAMTFSVAFLLCYVAYHITSADVKFGDVNGDGVVSTAEKVSVGFTRTAYLLLLISHITLAAVSLPFILFTFIAGWTNKFATHRRLARWVFPLWLYVAITGPVCYWMLRPYY
jgi:putative membrane protein